MDEIEMALEEEQQHSEESLSVLESDSPVADCEGSAREFARWPRFAA